MRNHYLFDTSCCAQRSQTRDHGSRAATVRGLRYANTVIHDLIISREAFEAGKRSTLLQLACRFEGRLATDPRDLVFALVGLAKDVPPNFVDYGHDVRATFITSASKLISHTKSLEVLIFTATLDSQDSRLLLPTWCPDWTSSLLRATYQFQLESGNAAGKSRAEVNFLSDERMRVYGTGVDTITVGGACLPRRQDSRSKAFAECARDWCRWLRHEYCVRSQPGSAEALSGSNVTLQNIEVEHNASVREVQLLDYEVLSFIQHNPQPSHTLQDAFISCLIAEFSSGLESTLAKLLGKRELPAKILPYAKTILFTSMWYQYVEGGEDVRYSHSLNDAQRKFASWFTTQSGGDAIEMVPAISTSATSPTATATSNCVDPSFATLFEDLSAALSDGEVFRAIWELLAETLQGRRPFITREGYLGLAPETAQPGDQLGILFGGRHPFVLRPVRTESNDKIAEHENEEFTLIGPAWVHGIMHGEAMEALEEGKFKRRPFVIR